MKIKFLNKTTFLSNNHNSPQADIQDDGTAYLKDRGVPYSPSTFCVDGLFDPEINQENLSQSPFVENLWNNIFSYETETIDKSAGKTPPEGLIHPSFLLDNCENIASTAGLPLHDKIMAKLNRHNRELLQPNVSKPDISNGLEKRQIKKDLVVLEHFAIQNIKLMVYKGQLFEFYPPCWQLLNKQKCSTRLRRFLREHELDNALISRDYLELYNLLLLEPDIQHEKEFTMPNHSLNLLDGTLDLQSMVLRSHDPEDGYFHYLNLYSEDIFDPGTGKVFETFVQQISNGNPLIRQQLLELTALAMTNYEAKCFYVLLGPSNCGKTQWGRFLEELLGRDNVESIAGVHDFSNRFTTSALEGKLLGTCLDLPDTPLPSIAIGTIKQFVGDDPIKVEAKYKNSHTIYRKPMLLFAGNHPIQLPALSNEQALLNRMVVVPFANPVSEQDTIPQLYKLLLEESPYIVAEAIRAYQVLMQNNFIVTRTEIPPEYAPQDSRENYQTVKQFISDCCSFNEENEIETATLYNAYQRYAEETGIKYASRTDFSRLLSELLKDMPTVKKIKRVRDSNARGYRGIQLNEE